MRFYAYHARQPACRVAKVAVDRHSCTRICVGLLFVISGGGKLFSRKKRETMQETLRTAGIPLPNVQCGVRRAG